MKLPESSTALNMQLLCTKRYEQLIADGCAEDVALDRTWDAYVCALTQSSTNCYDPRDRLFESKLRTIREKG